MRLRIQERNGVYRVQRRRWWGWATLCREQGHYDGIDLVPIYHATRNDAIVALYAARQARCAPPPATRWRTCSLADL